MANEINDVTRIPKPQARPLRVYAFDPAAGRYVGNKMVAEVRYEELKPGPIGERFAVVDYDATQKVYYKPVDLDDPRIVRLGLHPSESDPRFHQQMVYAVASETLQRFEVALGRRVPWARFGNPDGIELGGHGKVKRKSKRNIGARNVLFLFPHAMAEANAYYSREAQGILFGYFRASATDPGFNLPNQVVYSCLSHDIIAHETTHAILDGIRSYFTEPTNIDVAAFHEAFADISALFCHFSHQEVLLDTLRKTGGRLYDVNLQSEAPSEDGEIRLQTEIAQINPLAQLALQFGEASGMNRGLRQMLGTPPNSYDINTMTEPHDRGAILVAAVFDAYFTIYTRRSADLFRIYRSGGGSANPVDLPDALTNRLVREAGRTAEEFFSICARALDYCPPVDIEFGDFLRAIITAHSDFFPLDPDGVREAFLEAFRLRGIVPKNAGSLTQGGVCWPQTAEGALPPVEGLIFGDPNGLTTAEKDLNGDLLRAYAKANAKALGFDNDHAPIAAPSFHPIFRIGPHGNLITDMVVELVETRIETDDEETGPYPFRSGVTLLIWQGLLEKGERAPPRIHYVIPKFRSEERRRRQSEHLAAMQRIGRPDEHNHRTGKGAKLDKDKIAAAWRINFGLLHAGL